MTDSARPALNPAVYEAALERRRGSPEALLLLGHATGFCKEVWRPAVSALRELGEEASVLAWDARGHGSAPPFEPPVSWWTLAEDLAALAEGLPRTGALVGVGHSMGGSSMLMAELLRPGLFDGLVLIEPVVLPSWYRPEGEFPLAAQAARRRPVFPSRKAAADTYRSKPLFRSWHPEAFAGYLEGGLRPHPDGVTLSCPPQIEAQVFEAGLGTGLFERLGEIQTPVRLVLSEFSGSLQQSMALLEQTFTHAAPSRLPGQTHMVVMERPDLAAAETAAFLKSLPEYHS